MSQRGLNIFYIFLYQMFVIVVGRILFLLPGQKFKDVVLNSDRYFSMSCMVILAINIIIYFFKVSSPLKKLLAVSLSSFLVFIVFGSLYFMNLPQYTYEEAVEIVESSIQPKAQAIIPEHREDRIGYREKGSFLRTTDTVYYIYLNNIGSTTVYRFFPITGEFEERAISPPPLSR